MITKSPPRLSLLTPRADALLYAFRRAGIGMHRHALRAVLYAFVLLVCVPAQGYQFTPSDTEWHSWPAYCKAKYVWTNIGKRSKFSNMATQAEKIELAHWEQAGMRGLHHFCTGSIWLDRARRAETSARRESMLRRARSETQFTYERSNASSPQFAVIATQMATIMYEQDNLSDALNVLHNAISANPRNGVLYSATAVVQRKLGRLNEAKEILLQGDAALNGKSAEVNYNLGLVSLELGEIDEAVRYADLAYAMGFPLPGLRTKLRKLGRM